MEPLEEALEKLGEVFILGFEGIELGDDTAAFLSQASIGGVILFSQNFSSPEQVTRLINQVQECRHDLPLWISIDQEGGRVQRFKEPFTRLPTAAQVAAKNSPKLAFELAEGCAKELRAVGVNLNFAPIADIMTNPKNPVIGDRSYGTTEEIVSKMVSAVVRGHLSANVQPCVKHFPGHGDTELDSHLALPKINVPLTMLKEREFRPFQKAFKSHCRFVMTAHVLNPQIDQDLPATLSKRVLQEILRGELRYSGIIVSDDMQMQAITDHYGAADAPRLALEAGCNLLIYRSEKNARQAYSALHSQLQSGALDPRVVIDSAEKLRELKEEVLVPYESCY